MAIVQIPGAARESENVSATSPLVVLFERDDAIAVPLLSQLRLANYDVRSSRTPVELFDILSKHLVSLVLVDLGNATASRREFWVAMDAQRKGRAIQVMTFRYIQPGGFFDTDFDVAPRALADVEVHGAHEFQLVVEGVRQRIPLAGAGNNAAFGVSGPFALGVSAPGMAAGMAPGMYPAMGMGMGGAAEGYPGGIAPIGAALGVPSPFMQNPVAYDPYAAQAGQGVANAPAARPMPPVYPYNPPADGAYPQGFTMPDAQQAGFPPSPVVPGQAPSFTQPPAHAWPFPPPVVSSSFPSSAQAAPAFGAAPFPPSPFAASDPSSPFAHPIETNPFAQEAAQSPFARPYSANPFSDTPHDNGDNGGIGQAGSANPFAADLGGPGTRGPSALSPMGTSTPGSSEPWWAMMNDTSGSSGSSDYAAGFAVAEPAARPFALANGFTARNGAMISDVWTPPDEDFDQQTGVVPEVDFAPAQHPRPAADSTFESAWSRAAERPDVEPGFRFTGGPRVEDASQVSDETAPLAIPGTAASRLPAVRRATPTETALGNVLVEGALLSSQKLEALRGIQQMLSSVDMNFKLGELALLFKFLSPDQLLAALLVSRGLVSPGQIAGLGRVKQELGATGMDYDLETLLVMFHILPTEQLRQLRAELSSQQ